MLGSDPPPPGMAGRAAPAQTPPPGTVKEGEGGGGWANGLPRHPPPQSNFPPALWTWGGAGRGGGPMHNPSLERGKSKGPGPPVSHKWPPPGVPAAFQRVIPPPPGPWGVYHTALRGDEAPTVPRTTLLCCGMLQTPHQQASD